MVNGFRSRIEEKFPWLIDEMQGISDGAQIPFDTVITLFFKRIVSLFEIGKNTNT